MKRVFVLALALVLPVLIAAESAHTTSGARSVTVEEFRVAPETMEQIRGEWIDSLLATHEPGTWAEMKFEPTDDQLRRMGLPSRDVLLAQRYPVPTMVMPDGSTERVELPSAAAMAPGDLGPTATTFAGAGWFGIRPGAFLLLLNDNSIGWCSMAHVYGAPGNYDISTAGHCGRTGDTATVIAGFGNRDGVLNPILLDFGTFGTSHDGGLGNDWALIDIDAQWQYLVTPTMAFWGGPRGVFTKTGSTVGVTVPRKGWIPNVTVSTDPLLAQPIVHYGHGTGVGAGGTPRAGVSHTWGASHFMFEGVITWGDSGSGANTLGGDTIGANMEAAGIMTHLYIDPLMRQGVGIMGGTRATAVSGTVANGQIVPYPVPVTGLP